MKSTLIKYLEKKAGRELSADEIAQELNGVGLMQTVKEMNELLNVKDVLKYTDREVDLCYECAGFTSFAGSDPFAIRMGLRSLIRDGLVPTIEEVNHCIKLAEEGCA